MLHTFVEPIQQPNAVVRQAHHERVKSVRPELVEGLELKHCLVDGQALLI